MDGGSMSKSRMGPWLTLILVVIGVPLVGIPGLWIYKSLTAIPLHPNPDEAPAVLHSTPETKWSSAVEEGRQIVRSSLKLQNLPGVSVAVGIGDTIVWAEGFGFADMEARTPLTPKHRMRIGTASKVLTSAAVGLLIEQGQLKLDETIQTRVPAYPVKQWPVTLRHLMGHTAGVVNDQGDEGPLLALRCDRPVEAVQHFAQEPLLFEPGTKFKYSSYGWILVSAAVEAAAGEPYLKFLRDTIFDPLGMRDTLADSSAEADAQRVTPYFPRFAADPTYGLDLMRDLDYTCYAGASIFVSTPSDLVRFGMAIQGGKLLQKSTVEMLQTSQKLRSGGETGYGLGWDLETVQLLEKTVRMVGHDGDSLGGMVSTLMTFREQGLVVAVISNTSYSNTFSLGERIAQAFAEAIRVNSAL
jgi:serine beta-lactamase-like protein LACTB